MQQNIPNTPTKISQSNNSYHIPYYLNQSPYQYRQYAIYGFQTQKNQYLNHNQSNNELEQQENQNMKNEEFNNPATLIKANIINNRTMIFTNYVQLDYAIIFEEQLKIINNHQDFIKKLCSLRLDLPNIQLILANLKQLKEEILSKQLTENKQIYEKFIKPKTQQMIYQSIQLQKNIESLLNIQEQPKNPCYQNQIKQEDQKNIEKFDDQVLLLLNELNENEELAARMLTSIKYHQAQYDLLKDETIIKQQQEQWDIEKNKILDYLKSKLTQSILNLIQSHQQQIFKIQQEYIQPSVHSKKGIVYIYEILFTIEGQLHSIEQIQLQIRNFEQQIIQLKVNYHEFEEFYKQIKLIHVDITQLSKKVKQINQTQIQPLLQQYQLKQRIKCKKRMANLETEIKQLISEGQLIQKFNLKEKIIQFESFNFDKQIQEIQKQFQEFEEYYAKQQFQVPFSKIKAMNSMIIKFEEDHQNANQIIMEVKRLLQFVTFIGFVSYLEDAFTKKYTLELQKISLKKSQIMSLKFCNQDILSKITAVLNFQFPYFDWNEQLEYEKDRICIIQERFIWARETVIELNQIQGLTNEIKVIKQLFTLDNELEKSLTIVERYLEIKEKLGQQRIDLIEWPQEQLEIINESSSFCSNILLQTNDRIKAIQQLNQMQLLQKLESIFQDFNQQSQSQILALSNEIKKYEFSQIIKPQFQIVQTFLSTCLHYFDDEIDKKFCQTQTYQELEDLLGGTTKFDELRKINQENKAFGELSNILYNQVSKFMKQKLKSDFSNLFQLKVIQSQGGTNNYDPYKLQLRTDLLYPIYRPDIDENIYCIQEKVKIENIIDQPDLRKLFQEFRTFINKCTNIMQNNNQDNANDQELILQLIEVFEQQLTLNIHLTDLQFMKSFHEDLKKWPYIKQFEQKLLPLGIVLKEEYSNYLDACRKRVISFTQGISIVVHPNQENLIQDLIKFNFNGTICSLHELSQKYLYKDFLSIVVEQLQGNLKLLSNHIVLINGKQLQYNDEIQL